MSLSIELHWLNPLCWAGPILDKELRVVSRRKRTYWIKGLFPVFLAVIVLSGWVRMGRGSGLTAAGLQQLAQLSRSVVSSMTWLQFVLCQCMAVMMMSQAMHDEIRRRTLDVLMTTPIRTLQIVLGKLFGQLMMVWIVLALSLPVLAIIRVWGGVPWEFLVATFAVTLSSTLCMASLSMFLTFWMKRSQQVILVLFSLLALSYVSSFLSLRFQALPMQWLTVISPFSMFYELNRNFNLAPGRASMGLWVLHCMTMFALGMVLVILCVAFLRRRILNTVQGSGGHGRLMGFLLRVVAGRKRRRTLAPRTVTGAPVLWKELGCAPKEYLKRQWPWIVLLTAGLVVSYLCQTKLFQMLVSWLRLMVLLRVSVMAALCVAQEKEARTWPALLCTPISDIWLLRYKAIAVLLRNSVGWMPVMVACAICLVIQKERSQPGILMNLMGLFSLAATLYMVTGMGLCASIRARTGGMAITSMLIMWFVWQLIIQMLVAVVFTNMRVFRGGSGYMLVYTIVIPIISVVVGAVMFKIAGRNLHRYVF